MVAGTDRNMDYRLLEALAREDPSLAALAAPLAVAFREVGASDWQTSVLSAEAAPGDGIPFLAGGTLRVDVAGAQSFLAALTEEAVSAGARGLDDLPRAIESGRLPVLALLEAGVNQDEGLVESLAAAGSLPAAPLTTIAHLFAMPPLTHAEGLAAARGARGVWQAGYCPICAGWPSLAEVRGVERERWLHCGRCGATWRYPNQVCVYCGSADHRRYGYLSIDGLAESRRAETCGDCGGYLKAVAANVPLSPVESAVADLRTLDLDLVALARGQARPRALGFQLTHRVVPL